MRRGPQGRARLDGREPAGHFRFFDGGRREAARGVARRRRLAPPAPWVCLGEYSALCFAGAISFADGVKLTKLRGEAMQAASDAQPSGMVSVIGLDKGKVADLCKAAADATGEPIAIANFLCNGNYACSGSMAAVDKVAELAKPEFKARMAVKLAVAGAFHTDFMAPAVSALSGALADTDVKAPRIPVVSNVDAAAHADPAVIGPAGQAGHVAGPLRGPVANLLGAGFAQGYELGPGKVIAGIFKPHRWPRRPSRTSSCNPLVLELFLRPAACPSTVSRREAIGLAALLRC